MQSILFNNSMDHYNDSYFEWQSKIGEFGGKVEYLKFREYISENDKVIDFGCGGGFLLKSLNCVEKIGVEINPYAREFAKKNGINVVEKISYLPDNWADIIISNHALEHTPEPLSILSELFGKLKKGGLIIIVVPQEFKDKYKPDDVNQHLYTWTPSTLGNLMKTAGFNIINSKTLIHKWPPYYETIYKTLGQLVFNMLSFFYCLFSKSGYQVRTVGQKNN